MKDVLKKSPLEKNVTGIYIKKSGNDIPDEGFCLIFQQDKEN